MKISIITWDASFRESYHTVDSMCQQDFPRDEFEFIWVNFYKHICPKLQKKVNQYLNARVMTLGGGLTEEWHLGKCLNFGIKRAKGDIIVLADGDIIVEKDHLKIIEQEFRRNRDLVLFFRRWDELKDNHNAIQSYSIDYLEKYARLLNPTNYAGCYATTREALNKVNGFEENDVFSGPGANALDMYVRFRNAGYAIKWNQKKIFHPWHSSTGHSNKMTRELKRLSCYHSWIIPYSGLLQSWILHSRSLDLSYFANDDTLDEYISNAPTIKSLRKAAKSYVVKSLLKTPLKIFFKRLKEYLSIIRRI